jgi:predicted nucleotidyltransferase component of viral defense system
MFSNLQQREVFHLALLRQFAGRVRADAYAVKGGVNLRLFFGSPRYSEDMDIDVKGVEAFKLKDIVMDILSSKALSAVLWPYNLEKIVPPDIAKAKQTDTTQRFKVHLVNSASEDLFTKIEFSRRGLDETAVVDPVDNTILMAYKLPPVLVPHYPCEVAIMQKICALSDRKETQGRDIFDIYMLLPRVVGVKFTFAGEMTKETLKKAFQRTFDIDFSVFRDTVVPYLSDDDQLVYGRKGAWEEIQLKVGNMLTELLK